MNIYQIYLKNNLKIGFWVKKYTWENFIAKIISIDGVVEGEKIKGKHPYYNNPKVIAKFYKAVVNSNDEICKLNFVEEKELSSAGNYSYKKIE